MRQLSVILGVGLVACGAIALVNCGSSSSDSAPSEGADAGGATSDGATKASDAGAVTVDTSGPMTCKVDSDCTNGEICTAGVCGLSRCSASAVGNTPPLGKLYALAPVRQVVLANATDPLALSFDGSPLALVGNGTFHPTAAAVAIAAGRFAGTANAGLAVAQANVNGFLLLGAPGLDRPTTVSLGFAPVALSARDFDADGIDEVVALGPGGEIALCTMVTSICTSAVIGGHGVDVAAGDALQDGVIRAVAYTEDSTGAPTLTVWSPTVSGAPAQSGHIAETLTHLALGDVDHDGHDDIVGLEDSGYLNVPDDHLHVYKFTTTTLGLAASVDVSSDSVDFAVGTFDGTKGAQITLLRANSVVDEYTGASFGALSVTSTATLDDVSDATMLTLGDIRGLSAMGVLEGDPSLVQGPPTPIFAAYYPPFSTADSDGVSDVVLTSTTTASDQSTQSLSLQATATIAYSESIPDVAMGSISASISGTLAASKSNIATLTLAETFSLYANSPDLSDSAAVLVAGTCFRSYSYRVVDPSRRLGVGADGSPIAVLTPVSVERSVWSLQRYNAVAAAVGSLPILPATDRIGQPSTYPAAAKTFAGQPIEASDLVFPQLDSYEVTNAARIDLHLTLSDQSVNMAAVTGSATLSGSVGAGGVTGSEQVALSYNDTETISLGTQTDIAMDVPQLRPGVLTSYAFTPVLYKEHYGTNAQSSLYVLSFDVGK